MRLVANMHYYGQSDQGHGSWQAHLFDGKLLYA